MADEGILYARVKPYNPKRGYLVQRIHVKCLGRTIEGGDGKQRPIEWVQIRPDQAQLLQTYRQDAQDPDAKLVFDIVTLEQRQAIDRAEDAVRLAGGSSAPQARKAPKGRVTDVRRGDGVADAGETEEELNRRKHVLEGNEQELNEATHTTSNPTLIAGAEAFIQDPAVVGRMQALSGLDRSTSSSSSSSSKTSAPAKDDAPEKDADERPTSPAVNLAPIDTRPKRRGVRTRTQPRAATDLPPMEEGADINEAIGNQPAVDPDGDD